MGLYWCDAPKCERQGLQGSVTPARGDADHEPIGSHCPVHKGAKREERTHCAFDGRTANDELVRNAPDSGDLAGDDYGLSPDEQGNRLQVSPQLPNRCPAGEPTRVDQSRPGTGGMAARPLTV